MKRFAVFDIDGTLIRWQLYHVMTNELAKQGALGSEALATLKTARMRWKQREHPDAFAEYEQELVKLFESNVATIKISQFDDLLDDIIDQYKNQVYTYTRDLIAELKLKGYFIMAISGSHDELVAKLARHYRFDDSVGTKYARNDEGFTGEKFIASQHKKRVLEQLISKHNLDREGSYAVGDSHSDAAMLEMVDNPIAFNPDQRLLAIAKTNKWPVVVERKNVIYELEATDNGYILA